MPSRYVLFFGDHDLGAVEPLDSDFPNDSGKLTLARKAWDGPAAGPLRAYFDYCLEADQIWLEEGEEPWQDFIAEREPDFAGVIDSEAWRLVKEDGTSEPIVAPFFYVDGTLGWRWNGQVRPEIL
jgi:hypothetical protein